MANNTQPLRGMRDLLANDCRKLQRIYEVARKQSKLFGFSEIQTPIMESISTFDRSLGDTSDVVMKQMYSFDDKDGAKIVLRPEGTAGVARAVVENALMQSPPVKLFYSGPMFRYERPQKGRYRQFDQFGAELLGSDSPMADVEILLLAQEILNELGIAEHIQLELNTIGDTESRTRFREQLVTYLSKHRSELSADSQARLERNPLRILDSKDENDRKLLEGAPSFADALNETSSQFFKSICSQLDALNFKYKINLQLVRGFDYYCHTVFEFTTDKLGSQSAVLSGGRYNGLVQEFGGPPSPAVGWGIGVDRMALLLDDNIGVVRPVAVLSVSESLDAAALKIAMDLRQAGIMTEVPYTGNVGKKMKRANKINASFALILGETEYAQNKAVLKELDTGTQTELALNQVVSTLKAKFTEA